MMARKSSFVPKEQEMAVKAFDEAFDELESKGVLVMKDWEPVLDQHFKNHPDYDSYSNTLGSFGFQRIYYRKRKKFCASVSEEKSDLILEIAEENKPGGRLESINRGKRGYHISKLIAYKMRGDEKIYPFNSPSFAKIPFRDKDELDMFQFLHEDTIFVPPKKLHGLLVEKSPMPSEFVGRLICPNKTELVSGKSYFYDRLKYQLCRNFYKYGRVVPVEKNPFREKTEVAIRRTQLPNTGVFFDNPEKWPTTKLFFIDSDNVPEHFFGEGHAFLLKLLPFVLKDYGYGFVERWEAHKRGMNMEVKEEPLVLNSKPEELQPAEDDPIVEVYTKEQQDDLEMEILNSFNEKSSQVLGEIAEAVNGSRSQDRVRYEEVLKALDRLGEWGYLEREGEKFIRFDVKELPGKIKEALTEPMTAPELAAKLGRKTTLVKSVLRNMIEQGDIKQPLKGKYALVGKSKPLISMEGRLLGKILKEIKSLRELLENKEKEELEIEFNEYELKDAFVAAFKEVEKLKGKEEKVVMKEEKAEKKEEKLDVFDVLGENMFVLVDVLQEAIARDKMRLEEITKMFSADFTNKEASFEQV